jgi:glycosyltransferase involved in cell wall biosynthesis
MTNKRRILVTVSNDLATDNRVDKVCTFLHQQGFDVLLIGCKRKNRLPLKPRDYRMKRMWLLFDKGPLFYAEINIKFLFTLLFHRSTDILANDLDTLLPGFLAAKLKRNRIYYDTHEYFTEVPELTGRPAVKKIWETIEGWAFPKATKVYTVNESIASRYLEKYKRPVEVVRNVSRKWNPERIQSRSELGLPEGPLLIVQGAGIHRDRGIEEAVQAMQHTSGITLLIIGDGDVIPQLKEMVRKLNLQDKVLILGKRPYSELMHYTYHASLGLTLDKDTNLNYKFSLPNKIFDYIHAGTPVLASDLPEIRKIIDGYSVGGFIPSHDPKELAHCFTDLLSDKETLEKLKENCAHAAQILCWEHEETVLKNLYALD